MRFGVLTGGGDCPGLNAVIRAIVRKSVLHYGHEILGFRDGWRGPLEGDCEPLTNDVTRGILPRGGTILGSSRTNPFKRDDGVDAIRSTFERFDVDGLIAIGGEDTLGVANRMHTEHALPLVGVPKTIDNDLGGTEMTFGFDTAVQVATDAIDRLHTTAESHNRVLVLEVMGRHAGWIALRGGTPTAFDRVLATRFGVAAIDAADARRWGTMPALRGGRIELVALSEAVASLRTVSEDDYHVADSLIGLPRAPA